MKEKIELILEQLYAIKDDDKFYFMAYGKDWIEELCEVSHRQQLRAKSKSFLNVKTIADLKRLFPDQNSYGVSCDKDWLYFFVNGEKVLTKPLNCA